MNGEKGILTVVGEVEPVPIFKALKKTGVTPEIVSVGPPIPQRCGPYCNCSSCQLYGHQLQKTWNEPVNTCSLALPCSCNRTWCKQCELVAVDYPPTDNTGQCSIQWYPDSIFLRWLLWVLRLFRNILGTFLMKMSYPRFMYVLCPAFFSVFSIG